MVIKLPLLIFGAIIVFDCSDVADTAPAETAPGTLVEDPALPRTKPGAFNAIADPLILTLVEDKLTAALLFFIIVEPVRLMVKLLPP
jgi:hypothetical protein